MRKLLAIASLLVVIALPAASYGWTDGIEERGADSWGVDSAHTEINFSVNHFFTPVTGTFDDFEVALDYDVDNPSASRVSVRIAVISVNTGNSQRDEHLRTPDFFAAEQHPYITFESNSVRVTADGGMVAKGILEIRGQRREIELPINLLGVQPIPPEMRDMLGGAQEIASFGTSTTIDRGEYGVGTGSWAATLIVGGEVEIEILLEAHRK